MVERKLIRANLLSEKEQWEWNLCLNLQYMYLEMRKNRCGGAVDKCSNLVSSNYIVEHNFWICGFEIVSESKVSNLKAANSARSLWIGLSAVFKAYI